MAQQNDSSVNSVEEFISTKFDYIICGGGTAGCTVAARLSENPDVSVGVIEAGKYHVDDPIVDVPALFFQGYQNPDYDWCLYTAPQVSRRRRKGLCLEPFAETHKSKETTAKFTMYLAENFSVGPVASTS